MSFLNRTSKTEKSIIAIAVIGILASLYLLLFDNGNGKNRSSETELGFVELRINDARQKAKNSFVWESVEQKQSVHLGDSIYSGKQSQVQVQLKKGGVVDIGENSLVTFDLIEKEKVMDLEMGNFRVKVDGTLKISVQGKLTTIEGNKSDIQIFIGKDKKPKLKLINGQAEVKNRDTVVKLETRSVASLPAPEVVDVKPSVQPPPPPEAPVSNPGVAHLNYKWKLYDIYEQKDSQLFEKPYRPAYISMKHLLTWSSKETKPATVEWSNDPEFKSKTTFISATNEQALDKSYIGENFWRVSTDGEVWSETQKFTLTAELLENAEPQIASTQEEIPLLGATVSLTLPLKTNVNPIGFVAQASLDSSFQPEKTKTFWSGKPELNLSFYRPGTYFYRFRSVNQNQEISKWSRTVQFKVFKPELPVAPKLAKKQYDIFLGDSVKLAWKSKAKATRIEIFDEKNEKLKSLAGNGLQWTPPAVGKFKARAWTVDQYGQASSPTIAEIQVKPKPQILVQKPEPEIIKEEPERTPANVDNSTTFKLESFANKALNEKYKNSKVSAQGLLWTLQSTDQKYANQDAPIALGFGLMGQYWKNSHGFEGSLKTAATSSTGNESRSLKDLEARYHYRIFTGFPLGLTRELQISAFGGYQMYRNSGSYISNQYDLIKFGTSLEFPVAQRWSSGGEISLGMGTDQSRKYEISGNLNYFMDPSWSIGVGYKLNLFEAGSTRATPSGVLPYREGYTEGFSKINYHF